MVLFGNSAARHFRCGPKFSSKRGSSLALVMVLSAVLLLLGTALLPIAITADNEAEIMESRYENYLLSRSAIEYAKGELGCMVQTGRPQTFAVLRSGSGFLAVQKTDSGISINSAYADCIDFDPLGRADDTQDRPKTSSAGDQVAAICAVVPTESASHLFEITICSFVEDSPRLTWNAEVKEGDVP